MDVMYPHAIDRLRVMHFLLRAWRYSVQDSVTGKTRKYTQAGLAKKAKFRSKKGDIISDLESLNKLATVALQGKRLVARRSLIRVLNIGLKRSQKDIDAILWLYEGELFRPLQQREVAYKDSLLTITHANQYTSDMESLRSHILNLLAEALRVFIPSPIKNNSKVQMIFELDQALGIESDQILREIEHEHGQRLTVTKSPSFLTYPLNIYDYGYWRVPYKQLSNEEKQKRREVTDERRQIFLERLKDYGERSIHSKESLERYLQPECKHWLSYDQRIKQVRRWIKLLKTNKHYNVGLCEQEPEFELAIKNTVAAFLSGLPGETNLQETQNKEKAIHCGPWYVMWRDEISIFAYFVDFERKWDAIPKEWRNKKNVTNWLKERLPKSHRK